MNIINLRKTLLSAVIIASPVFVQAIDYTYVTNGAAITITGYTGTDSDIIIPDTITGLPVVTIGEAAFSGSAVLSVSIPNSITNVEQLAFMGCGSLSSITIPNSVLTIGSGAFYQCTSLTSISMPRDLETIAEGLLAGCTNLSSVSIPNYVSVIENAAFGDCSSLTTIDLPNSVEVVMQEAFHGCSSLQVISIGKNLHTFDLTASGLTQYGGQPLYGCSALTAITVDKQNNYFSSDDGVLLNKDQTDLILCPAGKIGNYIAPGSVTNIGTRAFFGCETLTNIILPEGLISIGTAAFLSCRELTSITIPDTVTSIDSGAFYACTNLLNINIPDGITLISPQLFRGCHSLKTVTVPGSITNIWDEAFADCTNLISVLFKGNAPVIGMGFPEESESIFSGSPSVTSFYLSETTGWGATFGERPAVLWASQVVSTDTGFGIQTNGFNFSITGPTNLPVVVEASASLGDAMWVSLQNAQLTNGTFAFKDGQWTNYATRFYRVRAP